MKGKAPSALPLNEREQEILQHPAAGSSDQQIADELFLSLNTVKCYNRQIYSKLGVGSRTQASSGNGCCATRRAIGISGEAIQAACLLGASEMTLERLGAFHQLNDKSEIDTIITTVSVQLDEATFKASWANGRKLTLDQAGAQALDE